MSFTDISQIIARSETLQFSDQHCHALMLYHLLFPKCPLTEKGIRTRGKKSRFKIFNAMYQLTKRSYLDTGQKSFGKAKITIAKTARVGKTSVTDLICDESFPFYCSKISQFKGVNCYELKPWVIEFFKFFEMKGMMKGIIEDFEQWSKTFKKRMDNWLLPLLEKGYTLNQILMNKLSTANKLSTKSRVKPVDPNPLKPAGIKPSGSRPFGDLNDTVNGREPFFTSYNNYENLASELDSLGIKAGDRAHFFNNYGIYQIRGMANTLKTYIKSGTVPRNPVTLGQKILNDRIRGRQMRQ